MTIDEIAKQLGVSKSTVSRALSGKGRIGAATREKIVSFVTEQGVILKEEKIKSERTYNLGVVFPADNYNTTNPFFQECLLGICDAAAQRKYNVMLTRATTADISEIQKLVEKRRVDGLILTRSLIDDRCIRYLCDMHFPVAVTGHSVYGELIQADTDNGAAAEELTSVLIGKGFQRFALIVEDFAYYVNRSRYEGFCRAIMKNGLSKDKQMIHTGSLKMELLDGIISDIINRKTECIICGDDEVCTCIMSKLQSEGYRIPRDIAIASLYNSKSLDCCTPAVTAVNIAAREVGNAVARQMINYLQGKEINMKTIIDYEILLRKSTDRM